MMDVRIDGVPVASFAYPGSITWSDRFGDGPCGPDELSFTVAVDPSDDTALLRIGRVAECFDHGVKVFGGRISEMGRDFPRTMHCKGWARYVEGESTTVGQRFGRNVDNVAYTPVADTTPSWFLDASGLDIGVADDGLYTSVVATYVASLDTEGNPVEATLAPINDTVAQALYGVITYEMDQTDLGLQSSAAAAALATAQLQQFTVPQLLSRVTATDQILSSPGGHPAFLPNLRSGQMVEMFNVPNSLGGIQYELNQRFIIGETEHSADNPAEVSIAPQRLAVRNLLDALKQAAEAAKAVRK